jgi:hypothetical protein
LVSYARDYEEFQRRGFEVAGVSVDPPSHGRAMVDKLDLPFPLLSDPRGDLIRSLGLWNAKEGVSEPATVVLDRTGTVRYLYSGGLDFSDRPAREDLMRSLEALDTGGEPRGDGPVVSIGAEETENETVRPDKPPIGLDALKPYYRGVYYATVAMQKKLEEDGEARGKVDLYQELVKEYQAAIEKTVERKT